MENSHLLDKSALAALDDERFSQELARRLKDCIYKLAIAQAFPLVESNPKDMLRAKLLTERLMKTISRSNLLDQIASVEFFPNGELEKFQNWLTQACERYKQRPKPRKLPETPFKLEVADSIAQVFLSYGKKLSVTDSELSGVSDFVFAVEVALLALGRKRGDIKRLLAKVKENIAEAGTASIVTDEDETL